ncbi:MAG: ribosome recycling factor [Candidatus Yonathbacteria bacterium]|nr:ribosome recycling factor [Candidatus Yonathbacteria bacterium]
MSYDFSGFKKKTEGVKEHLGKELSTIHTGRANVALLDMVSIESYGARLAIPHVATITSEDARTLRIVPWEKSNGKEIERAINEANLGLSVSADDSGLRVSFPPLTTERRIAFTKIARDKVEEARIAVRNEREKTKNDIIAKERDNEMSIDEKKIALETLQKLVDDANSAIDVLGEKKEKEILGE